MRLIISLQEAGISRHYAPTVGIAVDPRRANLSVEGMKVNIERLKEYHGRLIVFPRRSGAVKAGDTKDAVKLVKDGKVARHLGEIHPIRNRHHTEGVSEIKKSELPTGEKDPHRKLRLARSDARLVGVREKREKSKADEAQAAKK